VNDDHLSLEQIAELDEGLLPPERISGARAHLHGCPECRARLDALAQIRSMLADLPPVTMPADVLDRLNAALHEASTERLAPDHTGIDADVPAPTTDRSMTVTPALATVSRPRFGRPTAAASAAAAAVVLAVGAIVFAHFHHTGTSPASTTSAAGTVRPLTQPNPAIVAHPDQSADYVQYSTGLTYTQTNLAKNVPGLVASVPGLTSATTGRAPHTRSVPLPQRSASPGVPDQLSGSTGSGGAAQYGRQPSHQTLSKKYPTKATSLADQPVPAALRPLYHSRQKLLQCAATLTTIPGAVPIAVDFGRWTGPTARHIPAVVFVFGTTDPNKVDVYVSRASCDSSVPLTYTTVDTS
jgi:hypothetical protein